MSPALGSAIVLPSTSKALLSRGAVFLGVAGGIGVDEEEEEEDKMAPSGGRIRTRTLMASSGADVVADGEFVGCEDDDDCIVSLIYFPQR